MKTTAKTKTTRKTKPSSVHNPLSAILHLPRSAPIRHSMRHHFGFWSLDFDGQRAVFDHEQGAFYVAYLLLNPPSEPIHGMALELKANAFFRQFPKEPCETLIADPLTGELLVLGCDAAVVERNLSVDDAEGLPAL